MAAYAEMKTKKNEQRILFSESEHERLKTKTDEPVSIGFVFYSHHKIPL